MSKTIIHPSIAAGSQFKNRIINGDMSIDQRYVGNNTLVTIANSVYVLDRWYGYGQAADGAFDLQRRLDTPPGGFRFYQRVRVTTADASIGASQIYLLAQSIEGSNVADLQWGSAQAKTVTLSFLVRSSLTGTFSGAIKNSATTRAYPFSFTINSANTWEQKAITIPGDVTGTWLIDTGVGVRLYFDLGCGTSNRSTAGTWQAGDFMGVTGAVQLISTLNATLDITGVQFEIGYAATEFEHRPIGVETDLCQRYFYKTWNQNISVGTVNQTSALGYRAHITGTGAQGIMWHFPVTMRTAPTMTFYNPNVAGSNWYNASDAGTSGASSSITVGDSHLFIRNDQVATDTIGDLIILHATADAEL